MGRTRQDSWSITLLQYEEDSTRYLEYHSVTIWRGLDKIPGVSLCYNLRTRQDTWIITLLQFDEDSTRYLESHSVKIWGGHDKIAGVLLCYNLRRTRQDTWSRTLLQFDDDSTRYLEYHSVITWWGLDKIPAVAITIEIGYCFAFTGNVSRNFGPATDPPVKQLPRYYIIFIQQLILI
jgi:hypothetical protein